MPRFGLRLTIIIRWSHFVDMYTFLNSHLYTFPYTNHRQKINECRVREWYNGYPINTISFVSFPNRGVMILYPQNNNILHIVSFCYPNYHYVTIWIHIEGVKNRGTTLWYLQNYTIAILFYKYHNVMPRFGPRRIKIP